MRWSGNDEAMITLARDNASAVGAGHTFLIFLSDGFFPVNVLAAVRAVPEICCIYCATANPTRVIVAQTELGRGVLGVVDGAAPLGVETDAGHCVAERPAAKDRLQAVVARCSRSTAR